MVTVPAWFDDAQRQSVGGMHCDGTLIEGRLGHCATGQRTHRRGFGLRAGQERVIGTVLVFDLGGGTFDCCWMSFRCPVLQFGPATGFSDEERFFRVLLRRFWPPKETRSSAFKWPLAR